LPKAVGVSSVGIEGVGFAIPIETFENVLPLFAAGSEQRKQTANSQNAVRITTRPTSDLRGC